MPQKNPGAASNHPPALSHNTQAIIGGQEFLGNIDLPKATVAPTWRETGIIPVKILQCIGDNESAWIVENLIREGDQVIMSGPPKSGKTILAMQLSIDLGLGNSYFLIPDRYKVPIKRKVLFLSFEMRPRAMFRRVDKQWIDVDDYPDLNFMFQVPGAPSHMLFMDSPFPEEVITPTPSAQRLHRLIQGLKPDLIIVDSLIQIHAQDENSNMKMGMLLRRIRRLFSIVTPSNQEDYESDLSGEIELVDIFKTVKSPDGKLERIKTGERYIQRQPIAHILLHHTRKAAEGMTKNFASPDAIRGASAIHSEADLALTLANGAHNSIGMHKSARDLSREKTEYFEIKTDPDGYHLHFALNPLGAKKKQALARIFHGLKSAGTVYAETVRMVLIDQKLLSSIMRGTSENGFRDGFVKRLSVANLNLQTPRRGSGHKTKIQLGTDATLEEFFTAFGCDATDADAYTDAEALTFPSAPGDDETTPEDAPRETTDESTDTPNEPVSAKDLASPRRVGRRGRPPGSKNKKK